MASKSGARPQGTDGSDFQHRQKVATNFKYSVQYKMYMKCLLPSICLFFFNLDLPAAYPWERVWCFSFIPILIALASFPKNKANLLSYHYYAQFLFGILPCAIGIGSQLPELVDYMKNTVCVTCSSKSSTPTFKGHFPMVILWYIFFLIAFQIHGFAMYFSYNLLASWKPDLKKKE
uniref:Protein jagunal n=1 Tax=Ditylenchus dipsaci TaxID=166011 RepID=A0A915DP58_9BILA